MIPTKAIYPENNPFFPLPADYFELTVEGQRKARVNACRLWTLPGPDAPLRLIASTNFFDQYYLHPDPTCDFDPGFYDMKPLVSAPFHWEMSSLWATNDLSVIVAPRGSAKSTHLQKDTTLRLVSDPKYSFAYCTSTHDNAKAVGQRVKDQCYHNRRIQNDFAPSYNLDTLKPSRGDKSTGIEHFYLANGSWIRCLSAESRARGLRVRRFRLDDPEYDAKGSTSLSLIRDYMERLVLQIALPMVLRAECGLDWTGTFVSRRHYLWSVVNPTADGGSSDERFSPEYWGRLIIRACKEDPETGAMLSCWPHMWPADDDEKQRLNLNPKTKTLVFIKKLMGTGLFNAEMQAKPGEATTSFFRRDTDIRGRHAYWLEGIDPSIFSSSPFASGGLMCYLHPVTREVIRIPLHDFYRNLRLFIAVDTAYTEKATSDRRVCHLMGVDPLNILFSLDLWSDRKADSVLIENTLRMAERWVCKSVHVEVVKESIKLYERFRSTVSTEFTKTLGISHIPAIIPFKPGFLSKTEKISTLDVRFDNDLIKLPLWRQHGLGPYPRLFEQIDSFNPDVTDGGLEKDDEVDTLSMSTQIIRGRHRARPNPNVRTPINPLEEIKAGRLTDANGTPWAYGIPLDMIPVDDLPALMNPPPTTKSPL